MADLPTNYLDDILAQSMNGKRKFRITRPDGTFEEVIIEDVSEYSQTGSTFGAGDINRTNQAVNEKFDSGDVVDPMLTTEEGFAADAYKTKLQFDEQNKNLDDLSKKLVNRNHKYVGTISSTDVLIVQHNLNIEGEYHPVVSIVTGEYVSYGVVDATSNSFKVYLVSINGYIISSVPVGTQIEINWCF